MERISFWYDFEDKDGKVSNNDIQISIENENRLPRGEVCEVFTRFLASIGFSTEGLSKLFD
jgi:hypothetical protein